MPESKAPGDTSYDIPGAVLITLGLASFVYGFTRGGRRTSQENAASAAARSGDRAAGPSRLALLFIVGGLLLVAAFVVLELRTRNPLLPMRIVLDRNRGGAYLTSTLVGAGLIGAFFFLSLYFQQVLELHAGRRRASPRCRPRWACSSRPARPAPWCPRSAPSR